jgi:hypothetical protein
VAQLQNLPVCLLVAADWPLDAWLGAGPYSLELARTRLFNCDNVRSESASTFRTAFSNL